MVNSLKISVLQVGGGPPGHVVIRIAGVEHGLLDESFIIRRADGETRLAGSDWPSGPRAPVSSRWDQAAQVLDLVAGPDVTNPIVGGTPVTIRLPGLSNREGTLVWPDGLVLAVPQNRHRGQHRREVAVPLAPALSGSGSQKSLLPLTPVEAPRLEEEERRRQQEAAEADQSAALERTEQARLERERVERERAQAEEVGRQRLAQQKAQQEQVERELRQQQLRAQQEQAERQAREQQLREQQARAQQEQTRLEAERERARASAATVSVPPRASATPATATDSKGGRRTLLWLVLAAVLLLLLGGGWLTLRDHATSLVKREDPKKPVEDVPYTPPVPPAPFACNSDPNVDYAQANRDTVSNHVAEAKRLFDCVIKGGDPGLAEKAKQSLSEIERVR